MVHIKGSIRDSVLTPKSDMKHLKKAKGHIGRNIVIITVKTDCISHSTNTLGKGMNPIILPPAMGK